MTKKFIEDQLVTQSTNNGFHNSLIINKLFFENILLLFWNVVYSYILNLKGTDITNFYNMNKVDMKRILSENLSDFKLSNSYGHRAVGDKIEADCSNIAKKFFSKEYVKAKSKRSIEDFSLISKTMHTFYDVKTHFIQNEKGFSMPNLISVKRLKKLLENDSQSLVYIFVDYKRKNGNVIIEDIHIKYVWELDWSILGIGALGKGQLQIKDANKELKFTNIGKKKWFEILKEKVNEFYVKEIVKINKELSIWK